MGQIDDTHPAELLLQSGLTRAGASCGTFYVRDPYWTHDLRLVYMPGVRVREPMYGFLIPRSASETVTTGPDEHYFQHGIDSVPGTPADLFGNFAQREHIASAARFIHRKDGNVSAVMFANFSDPAVRFDPWLCAELRDLFNAMVRCLPSIYRNLQNAQSFPVTNLLKILQPFERLAAMFHSDTSPSLEAYLQSVLAASLDVCDIDPAHGFGTVHLFDRDTRSLHLRTSVGSVTPAALRESQLINIEQRRGIVSWVSLKRRALLVQDLHSPASHFRPIHIQVQPDTKIELAVPMTAGDELIGIFNLESSAMLKSQSPFDLVRVVWYAANQAAIACRLAEKTETANRKAGEARRNAEMSAGLLRICSNSPVLGTVPYPLTEVAELASKFLRADRCDIWEYLPQVDAFQGAGSDYKEANLDEPPREKGKGWSHYVHTVGSPVWLTQICDEQHFKALLWDRAHKQWIAPPMDPPPPATIHKRLVSQQIGSELGIPIRLGGSSLGVAWIKYGDRGRREPNVEEIQLAEGFAGEAALVMSCVIKQELQEEASHFEGIEVIVKTLRHDMPDRFLGRVISELNATTDITAFEQRRPKWFSLLSLLKTFIENLRLYSPPNARVFNELPAPAFERVSLHDIVDEVFCLVDAIRTWPSCQNDVPANLFVQVDRTLSVLSLFCLVENAQRYTPLERRNLPIRVTATENGERNVVLRVDDHGYGLDSRVLQEIGTRVGLRQSHEGRTLSGMGFGAYLARRLMLAQRGDVRWETLDPHGTRVTIVLQKSE